MISKLITKLLWNINLNQVDVLFKNGGSDILTRNFFVEVVLGLFVIVVQKVVNIELFDLLRCLFLTFIIGLIFII